MVNTIALSGNLIIALGGMVIILAVLILYAISLILKLLKMNLEGRSINTTSQNSAQGISNNISKMQPVQAFNDSDDEEDRLVVALAASAVAADEKPNSHFHITKITRLK